MSASDGVGFVVDVSRRMIRMQDESLDIRRAEMENAGFVMIDPDDGMLVMVDHEMSPFLDIVSGTLFARPARPKMHVSVLHLDAVLKLPDVPEGRLFWSEIWRSAVVSSDCTIGAWLAAR